MGFQRNLCVVCGCPLDGRTATRHHIVPAIYRTHLPPALKTHLPHDVVALCHSCHERYEDASQLEKAAVARDFGLNYSLGETRIPPDIAKVSRAARALLRWQQMVLPTDTAKTACSSQKSVGMNAML